MGLILDKAHLVLVLDRFAFQLSKNKKADEEARDHEINLHFNLKNDSMLRI